MHVLRSLPRSFVLTAFLLATAAALPFFGIVRDSRAECALVIDITSDRVAAAQLFFDIGRGFNENDSAALTLRPGTESREYRFPFPTDSLKKLRFDPLNIDGSVQMRHPRIEDGDGRLVRKLGADEFVPVQQITDLRRIDEDGIAFLVAKGDSDPIFRIETGPLTRLSLGHLGRMTRHLLRWVIVVGLIIAAGVLVQLWLARRGASLRAWILRRPIVFLALVSAVSVGIQCHPVLFFGKSFVSPDIGCYMLYDGFPTLPAYQTEPVEDAMGSDTGAIMLSHLYSPKITHDALFRDGELPLWNRYNTCGVPALGQGQFMFGELLSIPAVLWQSEAWTWDFRFLVARWLYAFGAALAVWLLTRDLISAGVIGLTAAYIGFFGFRLNHPAQFALCAGPWILVAWLFLREATRARQLAWAALALIVANWEVHVSGTVKEATMMMVCVNFAGLLLVLFDRSSLRARALRLGVATLSGVIYVLATAPVWLTFLEAVQQAHTNYSEPIVSQIGPWGFIGFFEDLAYRSHRAGEPHVLPSANMVVLIGMTWALISVRKLIADRGMLALALGAFLPWAMAFAIVPADWLKAIPFVANIHHIDNTFSCALIVIGTVLAGGGIHKLVTALSEPEWEGSCILFFLYTGFLASLMYGTVQYAPYSPFFKVYVPSLALGLLAVHVALTGWRANRQPGFLAVALGAACVVLLWRHGTYLHTPFDRYVVNPKVRASFHSPSPGVQFVDEHMTEPSRPNGIRYNVFSGFSQMLGWESIYGVEALRSPWSEEVYRAAPINKYFWGMGIPDWSQWKEEDTRILQPILDALNVRFYLATPGTPAERMGGLRKLSSTDFDIYESPTVWPRAFFTDQVMTDTTADAWVARVNGSADRRPFATVPAAEWDALGLPAGIRRDSVLADRTVVPATSYKLTTNTTTFSVRASGPGVVVLGENYFPRDFRVTINGQRAPYFRVNHMFKGVAVPAAGDYVVRFEYWPNGMTRALRMAAIGGLLAVAGLVAAWWWGRPRSGAKPTAS